MIVQERSTAAPAARDLALALRPPTGALLAVVILAALALRLWGVNYGLPYAYHPDEPFMMGVAWKMYRSGDLNPHVWDYPTMQMYVLLALVAIREGFQGWLPVLATPGMEYLLGRLLNVAYGVGTVALVYWSGRRLFGRWEGVVGAALLATAQLHSLMSHFLKVDVPTTFWCAAVLAASARLLERPSVGTYALAGATVGLAAAGKYPAATVGVVVVAAHWSAWTVNPSGGRL
ncbi:MAG TPA: glycosyltransferase family 39 protein, partial [Chloroflexota bacterium]